jgi:hypothetical protein
MTSSSDVAEENIQPMLNLSLKDVDIFISKNKGLGRWFDGVDIMPSGTIKFTLSPESRMLHPDDESEGQPLRLEIGVT